MTDIALQRVGLAMLDAGLVPLPTHIDGSKRPWPDGRGAWAAYEQQRPDREQVQRWFANGSTDGIGVVAGPISGNLVGLDIEGRAVAEGVWDEVLRIAAKTGLGELFDRVMAGYFERIAGGGIHILVRCDAPVAGNQKLAERPSTAAELAADPAGKRQTLIETRGKGGFLILAPSGGRTHPNGRSWELVSGGVDSIVTLTAPEVAAIYTACRLVDAMPVAAPPADRSRFAYQGDGQRPGDRFNETTSWEQVLTPHGWVHVYTGTRNGHRWDAWRRPGKTVGISATTNANGSDTLLVHSTSTVFDTVPTSYDRFGAYARLEHGGDTVAAARALAGGDGAVAAAPVRPMTPAAGTERANAEEAFWAERPETIGHAYAFGRYQGASPWSTLGDMLARLSAATPYWVRIDDVSYGLGNLNLIVAGSGIAGGRKGLSTRAARQGLTTPADFRTFPPGTGQGIGKAYFKWSKGDPKKQIPPGWVWDTHQVLLSCTEVSDLNRAIEDRNANFPSEACKAFSGEALGQLNKLTENTIIVPADEYRLAMTIGVQPQLSNPLLGTWAGGFPMRIVFFSTGSPSLHTRFADRPAAVRPRTWSPYFLKPNADGNHIITVCTAAKDAICAYAAESGGPYDAERAAQLDNPWEPLNGHLMYSRLKVAALLALWEQRMDVTEDDWRLSGVIIDHSLRVRAELVATNRQVLSLANQARGQDEGVRRVLSDEVVRQAAIDRVKPRVYQRIGTDWTPRKTAKKGATGRDNTWFQPAIDELLNDGLIEERSTDGQGQPGFEYRRAPAAERAQR